MMKKQVKIFFNNWLLNHQAGAYFILCPSCKEQLDLAEYFVNPSLKVSPSVVCSCGFNKYIILLRSAESYQEYLKLKNSRKRKQHGKKL